MNLTQAEDAKGPNFVEQKNAKELQTLGTLMRTIFTESKDNIMAGNNGHELYCFIDLTDT